MLSGPICAMVWEGRDAVKTGRGNPPTWISIFNHLTRFTSSSWGHQSTSISSWNHSRGFCNRESLFPFCSYFQASLAKRNRMLAVMYATVLIALKTRKRRLLCGSARETSLLTNIPNSIGSTKSHKSCAIDVTDLTNRFL